MAFHIGSEGAVSVSASSARGVVGLNLIEVANTATSAIEAARDFKVWEGV